MQLYQADVSEPDLLSAFDNAPVGMAVLTANGVITACNAAMGRLLDRAPADVVGGTFFDVTHPDDLEEARGKCALMQIEGARIVRHECRFVLPGGRSRVPETLDRPAHLMLREALGRRGRHTRVGHLFYLDLDGFKAVNDRFGHAAGDAVLTQLAARIVALLRVGDIAARLGGDEFAVFCHDTEPHQALAIARRLRMAAAEPFLVDGSRITISAAVGCCATEHADAAALIREADRRMYEGKRRRPLRGRRSGQPW